MESSKKWIPKTARELRDDHEDTYFHLKNITVLRLIACIIGIPLMVLLLYLAFIAGKCEGGFFVPCDIIWQQRVCQMFFIILMGIFGLFIAACWSGFDDRT